MLPISRENKYYKHLSFVVCRCLCVNKCEYECVRHVPQHRKLNRISITKRPNVWSTRKWIFSPFLALNQIKLFTQQMVCNNIMYDDECECGMYAYASSESPPVSSFHSLYISYFIVHSTLRMLFTNKFNKFNFHGHVFLQTISVIYFAVAVRFSIWDFLINNKCKEKYLNWKNKKKEEKNSLKVSTFTVSTSTIAHSYSPLQGRWRLW